MNTPHTRDLRLRPLASVLYSSNWLQKEGGGSIYIASKVKVNLPIGEYMAMLEVDREGSHKVEVYFEDHGSGSPVVLIHGWPLSGRSWEPQIAPLIDAGYRVITYDRRGFGWSSQPWSGYDYDTLAGDLNQVLVHLNLSDVALVGFSMGGGEVARYIGTYGSERISKAVLAAAITPYMNKDKTNPNGVIDDKTFHSNKNSLIADRVAFLDEFATGFFSVRGTLMVSEEQRRYAHNIACFASSKGTLDCMQAFSTTDFSNDLVKFNLPTLIIHGDSDDIVPFKNSGALAHKLVANSKVALIKDGPHGFNLSHAKEFNMELINFLHS